MIRRVCVLLIVNAIILSVYATNTYAATDITFRATLASSDYRAYAIDENAILWSWKIGVGDSFRGQSLLRTHKVQLLNNVIGVYGGWHSGFAIRADNSLWTIDENGSMHKNTEPPIKIMDDVTEVACANSLWIALKTDGTVWQYPYNSEYDSYGKQMIMGVKQISANIRSFYALKDDGALWGWGDNYQGDLGVKTGETNINTPIKILDEVESVYAFGLSAFAIKSDGSLWGWGNNNDGLIFTGEDETWAFDPYPDGSQSVITSQFTPVKMLDDVIKIAGRTHLTVIKKDHSLWVWGNNNDGQLGDGTTKSNYMPTKLADNVVDVTATGMFTIFLKNDGTLWGCGKSIAVVLALDELDNNDARISPVIIADNIAQPNALINFSLGSMTKADELELITDASNIPDTIYINIDGIPLTTKNLSFIEQGEIMVPVQDLARAMDIDVFGMPDFYDVDAEIILSDKLYYTDLFVGINDGYSGLDVRGANYSKYIDMDWSIDDNYVRPMMIDGCVYVPLHPVAAVFCFDVQWDEDAKTATLTNKLKIPFFTDRNVNKGYSLLNNRLTISLPEGVKIRDTRDNGIRDSDTDGDYETSILFSGNYQTLEVKASELFAYSTGDLKKDAELFINLLNKRYFEPAVYSTSKPVIMGNLAYISIRPMKYDSLSDYLVEGALVRGADNMLVFVGVYADHKAMTYPEDCHDMAQKMIDSLKSGARVLVVEKQSILMDDYTIQLAPGYLPNVYRGPDFDVWYFNKLVTLDDIRSSFSIYRGNHPSYDESEIPTYTVEDKALNNSITWSVFLDESKQFGDNSYAKTLIRTGFSGWDQFMSIVAYPASESDWKIIREMVRSMHSVNDVTTSYPLWLWCCLIFVLTACIILLLVFKRRKTRQMKNS